MHWQSRTATRLLAAGVIATLSATASAATRSSDSSVSSEKTTTTTTTTTGEMVAVPAATPVVSVPVTTTQTTVVTAPQPVDDWSVFGGRVVKGSHMASAELLGFEGLVNANATYRFGLLDKLGVGVMFAWDAPFNADVGQTSANYYNAFTVNPFVTVGVFQRPRWDVGVTAAPGLRWSFGGCKQTVPTCFSESKALTLTIRAAALYSIVPRTLKFGGAVDIYSDMTFKNNGVSVTLPVLFGGVVEYHVSDYFALTAEAKGGFWAGNYYARTQNQIYYITRFAIGLAFHGVP